jgi:hypothetical protein
MSTRASMPSANKPRQVVSTPLRVVLGLMLLACLVVGALVLWAADPLQIKAPSDPELIAFFQAHRVELERLRQMVTEDMHAKSYFSESELDGTLLEARRQEYRGLLKIKSGLIVTVNYDKSVRFIFGIGGLSAIGPGWAKGIQFLPQGTKHIGVQVKTLDNERTLPVGVYLREIVPDWFILFQRDD